MNLLSRIKQSSRELLLFAAAALVLGMAFSMVDSTFNNFLNDKFALTRFPAFLSGIPARTAGISGGLCLGGVVVLLLAPLGVVAMIFSAVGAVLIGFASSSYGVMIIWLFIYSMGNHLFMPIASTIGMELAREGQDGRRLGQLNAIRNFAAIVGSFSVVLGFQISRIHIPAYLRHLPPVLLVYGRHPAVHDDARTVVEKRGFLQLHKEYRLYYILNVLSGARKQLFITFAPWVLVSVLEQPTQIMATLFTIGGVIGILFQPLLGWAIDKFGERTVLASEAVILVFVCFGYGFAKVPAPRRHRLSGGLRLLPD